MATGDLVTKGARATTVMLLNYFPLTELGVMLRVNLRTLLNWSIIKCLSQERTLNQWLFTACYVMCTNYSTWNESVDYMGSPAVTLEIQSVMGRTSSLLSRVYVFSISRFDELNVISNLWKNRSSNGPLDLFIVICSVARSFAGSVNKVKALID